MADQDNITQAGAEVSTSNDQTRITQSGVESATTFDQVRVTLTGAEASTGKHQVQITQSGTNASTAKHEVRITQIGAEVVYRTSSVVNPPDVGVEGCPVDLTIPEGGGTVCPVNITLPSGGGTVCIQVDLTVTVEPIPNPPLPPDSSTLLADAAVASWNVSDVVVVADEVPGNTIYVNSGDDLQAAINAASLGDLILLEPGSTFDPITLPVKAGSSYLTIRSNSSLPDRRIAPGDLSLLATIRSTVAGTIPINADLSSHHYKFDGICITQTGGNTFDLMRLGTIESSQNDLSLVPGPFYIDRCYFTVAEGNYQRRGIMMNSSDTTVTRCYIENMVEPGTDSQALGGSNGPGPYLIHDNFLEAAGENIMFGGSETEIPNLVPSDITITSNTFTKRLAWRGVGGLNVKNLFELKTGRNVTFSENVLYNCWGPELGNAQDGYAIVLTPRGGDRTPWAVVEDVTIENNVIYNVAMLMQISGQDYPGTSAELNNITIHNNLFITNTTEFGGEGKGFILGHAPDSITINNNTIIQENTLMIFSGFVEGLGSGLTITDNIMRIGHYGITGDGTTPGSASLEAFFSTWTMTGNVVSGYSDWGWPDASWMPASNTYIPLNATLDNEFVDPSTKDYSLNGGSPYTGKGCDFTLLPEY